MDQNYIFVGVSVAISVLGFFLRREARKAQEMENRIKDLEVLLAQNDVRDQERWSNCNKNLEDRRLDIKTLFDKIDNVRN